MFLTIQHAQSIVHELKKSIGQDINIMDATGRIMASTDPKRIGTVHQGAVQILRERLPSLAIRENDSARGIQKGINLPIVLEGEIAGVIGITGEPDEVAVFGDIIKRMTEVMVANRFYQEQADLAEQARTLFLENWLFSDAPDWDAMQLQGNTLGFDICAPHIIVLLDVPVNNTTADRDLQILQMIRSGLRDNPGHFGTFLRGRFALLFHQADHQEVLRHTDMLCHSIGSYYGITVKAGISRSSNTPENLRHCYQDALAAAAAASRTRKRQIVVYDETSLEFLVQSIPPSIRNDLHSTVFSACSSNETEEFQRLIALYFEKDGDIQACAKALYIHRNTFQYRMDQLKKKTGYDLKYPGDATTLLLACAL